jgi:hypothetical protein
MGAGRVEGSSIAVAPAGAAPSTPSTLASAAGRAARARDVRPALRGGHPVALPAESEEPRFVRGLMAALLPAGLLWLAAISLLRLFLG